jgi:hypothetical protein
MQKKRGWLTKLFLALGTDDEAQRFDLHKSSCLQALDRLERELIEVCPKAYRTGNPFCPKVLQESPGSTGFNLT